MLKCENCKHWRAGPNEANIEDIPRTCKRHPPVAVFKSDFAGGMRTAWERPTMAPDDFCGDHEVNS